MSADESALVVLVPDAGQLVKPFRDLYDPSAALGVPAHITLLYPFKPPGQIDDTVLTRLRIGFARFTPIAFTLQSIRHFPDVLYLAPDPAEPFRALTRTIWAWYPETPPYGGKWPDIVPHLSVASVADQRELGRIATEFEQASRNALPIKATANEISLLEKHSGRWMVRAAFKLGGA
jgi:2'-5' RNA ligase